VIIKSTTTIYIEKKCLKTLTENPIKNVLSNL